MKITEVLAILQAAIKEYGDLDCVYESYGIPDPHVKISQVLAILQAAIKEYGDLDCLYESSGIPHPHVHEVQGRKVMDLA